MNATNAALATTIESIDSGFVPESTAITGCLPNVGQLGLELVSFDLDEETLDMIAAYAERHDINYGNAVRHLIRSELAGPVFHV